MTGGTNTDVMTHCRILGLDEQYLTDLAQYQCQAGRLRARTAAGCTRGGRPGQLCVGHANTRDNRQQQQQQQQQQEGTWSLVDKWKHGKKSVKQVKLDLINLCSLDVILS